MILLEIIIALGIFGMCALGLMRAITVATQTAIDSQIQLRLVQRLQSSLTAVSKEPSIDQYVDQPLDSGTDRLGISTVTTVTRLENLETVEEEAANPVQDMYLVTTIARYDTFDRKSEVSASIVRYGNLYKSTTGAGATTPQQRTNP